MLPNRVCADWQKYLHFYLSGSVMVTIENHWYITETHCDQGTGLLGHDKCHIKASSDIYLSFYIVLSDFF